MLAAQPTVFDVGLVQHIQHALRGLSDWPAARRGAGIVLHDRGLRPWLSCRTGGQQQRKGEKAAVHPALREGIL